MKLLSLLGLFLAFNVAAAEAAVKVDCYSGPLVIYSGRAYSTVYYPASGLSIYLTEESVAKGQPEVQILNPTCVIDRAAP